MNEHLDARRKCAKEKSAIAEHAWDNGHPILSAIAEHAWGNGHPILSAIVEHAWGNGHPILSSCLL